MKILFTPVLSDAGRINYRFEEDTVIATFNGVSDTFDFSDFPDGKLQLLDEEIGEELIETTLEIQPIREAEIKDGVLYVKLLNYIGHEATEEERFPDWIDHTEYVPPKEVETDPVEEPITEEGDTVG